MVCLGYKRYYCFDRNQYNIISNLITAGNSSVSFLNGMNAAQCYKVSSVHKDGSMEQYCGVVNSCFHTKHIDARRRARNGLLEVISPKNIHSSITDDEESK